MTDEDTYTAPDGTRYRAEDHTIICEGCAFEPSYRNKDCEASNPCTPKERKDGRNIIWIKESP